MARAAGSGRNYGIAVVDTRGKVVEMLEGFPSVTTIIGDTDGTKSEALMRWNWNVTTQAIAELIDAEVIKPGATAKTIQGRLKSRKKAYWQVTEARAESGSRIHDWAEKLVLDRCTYDDVLEGTPTEDQGYAKALIAWHTDYLAKSMQPLAVERTLVSQAHRYAGTVDLIDYDPFEDKTRVVDYKTSKRVYDTHFIQGDAYAIAWQEMTKQVVDEIVVVRFDADGTYEEKSKPPEQGRIFLRMLDLYSARNT